MADDLAVEAVGLEKAYGGVQVLSGVDLRVARGSVFSLLGPNGAGKTTIVRILATLTRASAGTATVAGFDVVKQYRQVRRSISLTGQYAAVDALQTGEENLRMMARLSGLSGTEAKARAKQLLAQFDLVDAAKRTVQTYSGGMRRRLDLAAGLVGRPSVIFLDEPTTGLDPRSRRQMWEVIKSLSDAGLTVFLTTQYLEEADLLADWVTLLDSGKIVAEGTSDELKLQIAGQRLELVLNTASDLAPVLAVLGDKVVSHDETRKTITVATDGSSAQVRQLLDEIDPQRTIVMSFTVNSSTLDDVFLALTGRSASTAAEESDNDKEPAHV
jgi:ABC-2 type transport system ATP-binding protein